MDDDNKQVNSNESSCYEEKEHNDGKVKKIRKYQTNSPSSSYKNQAVYVEVLEDMFKRDDIRNIGIIAPFSGGKSSIIKKFIDTYETKDKTGHKYINVSLASFSLKEDSIEEDSYLKSRRIQLAEKSILEQILFKVDKKDVPYSRINRIEENGKNVFSCILLWITCLIYTLYTILTFNGFEMLGDKRMLLVYFPLAIIFLGCAIFFLAKFIKITKISIKNVEIDFNNIENGSVLNLFIDEIIYFFNKTKTKIVFFEDIDRFGCIELFEKLREINQIINRDNDAKKVTFIYAVQDNLFQDSEHRSKFFDFVVSPVPFLNAENVTKHISDILKECSDDVYLDEVFLDEISSFIKDKRTLNNTINDYFTFKDVLEIPYDDNKKLFAMMVYKNAYPNDFSSFINRNGDLYETLTTNKQSLVETLLEKNNKSIEEIDKKLVEINSASKKTNSFEELRIIVIGYLMVYGTYINILAPGSADITSIKTFDGVKNIHIRLASGGYYTGFQYKTIAIEDITKYLKHTPFQVEEALKGNEISDLEKAKKALVKQNNEVKNMTIKEIVGAYPTSEIWNKIRNNKLLMLCIQEGYIDDTYYKYIGVLDNDINNVFLNNIRLRVESDPMLPLSDPVKIIHKLSDSRFQSPYIFNFKIFDCLLTIDTYKDKKNLFLEYLCNGDDKSVTFIANYYLYGSYFINLYSEFYKRYPVFIKDILERGHLDNDNKSKIVNELLKKDIKFIKYYDVDNCISVFVSKHTRPIHALFAGIEDIKKLLDIIHELKITKFINVDWIETFNSSQKEVFDYILSKGIFEVNDNNIAALFDYKLTNKEVNLTTALESSESDLKDVIMDNIERVVKILLSFNYDYSDSVETIKLIVNSEHIDDEVKKQYLSHYRYVLDDLDGINTNYLPLLFIYDTIKPNWTIIENNISISDNPQNPLVDYIYRNFKNFEGYITNKTAFLKILNTFSFPDIIIYREMCKKIKGINLSMDEITNDYARSQLIDDNYIDLKEKEDIKKYINDSETLSSLLKKNNEYVETILEVDIDRSILMHLLNVSGLNIDIKSKIFVCFYEKLLDNPTQEELSLFVRIVVDNRDYPYEYKPLSKLIELHKDEKKEKMIYYVGERLKGIDLIKFLQNYEKSFFEDITHDKGDIVISDDTFNSKFFIKLLDEKLIIMVKNKKYHLINNENLFTLIE